MKVLSLIFCLLIFSTIKGQKANTCQALEAILKYEAATKPYYFDKNSSNPIIFYDTANVFNDCSLGEHYGRRVEVVNNFPSEKALIPSDYIIIIKHKTKRVLKIVISYKSSGAYCSFTLKKKKRDFRVIKFREIYL